MRNAWITNYKYLLKQLIPVTSPFRRLNIKPTKELHSNLKPHVIVPCPDGGFFVQYKNSCCVSRYDPQYNLLWQKEIGILPDKYAQFNLTVSSDGGLIGIHAKNVVRIFNGKGELLFSHDHYPWEHYESSECYFSATSSDGKKYIWFFAPIEHDGGYLHVLDASDFSLVDSLWQEDIANHFSFYPTPDNDLVFIEFAAGQDGSQIQSARILDQKIVLTKYDQCIDRVMGSFSPTGNEFVVAPHADESIEIFTFPGIEKVAEIDQESLFEGRDDFPAETNDRVEYVVHFLSQTTLMVKTGFGRLLLINRNSLLCTGELLLEGCNIIGYDEEGNRTTDAEMIADYESEIWDIKVHGRGQLLVIHTSNTIKVYDLPSGI